MAATSLVPTEERVNPGHELNAELQAFLEAFAMLELKELSKIA